MKSEVIYRLLYIHKNVHLYFVIVLNPYVHQGMHISKDYKIGYFEIYWYLVNNIWTYKTEPPHCFGTLNFERLFGFKENVFEIRTGATELKQLCLKVLEDMLTSTAVNPPRTQKLSSQDAQQCRTELHHLTSDSGETEHPYTTPYYQSLPGSLPKAWCRKHKRKNSHSLASNWVYRPNSIRPVVHQAPYCHDATFVLHTENTAERVSNLTENLNASLTAWPTAVHPLFGSIKHYNERTLYLPISP